jgi:hypothetical protein
VVFCKNQSPTDWLAALIVEDFRDPLDHRYWMAKFPASDKGLLGQDKGNLHPEKFHCLFTIIDDNSATNGDGSQVRFLGIERKEVVANHHSLQKLISQN